MLILKQLYSDTRRQTSLMKSKTGHPNVKDMKHKDKEGESKSWKYIMGMLKGYVRHETNKHRRMEICDPKAIIF